MPPPCAINVSPPSATDKIAPTAFLSETRKFTPGYKLFRAFSDMFFLLILDDVVHDSTRVMAAMLANSTVLFSPGLIG